MKTFLTVCILSASIACASVPLKQRAVTSLAASEMALEAAHDAERSICAPTADQSKPITKCDGPIAARLGLTDRRHQDLAQAFSRAFAAEALAAMTLRQWRAGDPAPTTLAEYQKIVNEILSIIIQYLPADEVLSKAYKAADGANDAVKATGGTK